MSLCSSLSLSISSPKSFSFSSKTKSSSFNGVSGSPVTYRFRASADVPDFLSADWYAFDSAYWIVGFILFYFIFSFLSWTFLRLCYQLLEFLSLVKQWYDLDETEFVPIPA